MLRTTIEVTCVKPLANGITLITTHGTSATLIHSDRRRSPLSASSNSATIGMTTTVLAGMQLPQHQDHAADDQRRQHREA